MPVPVIVYALLFIFEGILPLEQGPVPHSEDHNALVPAEVLVLSEGRIAERYYLTVEARTRGYVDDADRNQLFAFETLQRAAHMYVVYPVLLEDGTDQAPQIIDLGPMLGQFSDPRSISQQVLRGAQHPATGALGDIGIERIGSEYYFELLDHGRVLVVRPHAVLAPAAR
jgi:hypothetical protein